MNSLELFDLTGRRALITGSSKGIGFELARGLAGAGAEIILNGLDKDRLSSAARNLRAEDALIYELRFDVTEPDGVRTAIDSFEAQTGPIDILINNAGFSRLKPIHQRLIHNCQMLYKHQTW